jgi:hypothetical protein
LIFSLSLAEDFHVRAMFTPPITLSLFRCFRCRRDDYQAHYATRAAPRDAPRKRSNARLPAIRRYCMPLTAAPFFAAAADAAAD